MANSNKVNLKDKTKKLFAEFIAFIKKGNVLDMAIGVIMASSFGAIVTALSNILLSLCTWPLPGGISGLITILPAVNSSQKGPVGQFFTAEELTTKTIEYASISGATITAENDSFTGWQTNLLSQYTQHGQSYYSKQSAILNWGNLLNAIIAFLVIALILFSILKLVTTIIRKEKEFQAKIKQREYEAWAKKHPEEAKVIEEEKKRLEESKNIVKEKKEENILLLEQILDVIKKLKSTK